MSTILCSLILAAVTPLYNTANRARGDRYVMTNIVEWAADVGERADETDALIDDIDTRMEEVEERMDEVESLSYAWSSPGEWGIEVEPIGTQTKEGESLWEDSYSTFTNYVYKNVANGGAQLTTEVYDESEGGVTPPVTWLVMSPGSATVNESGVFASVTSGCYKVSATTDNGDARMAIIPVQQGYIKYTTNSLYFTDHVGTIRKRVNDQALAVISNATFVGNKHWSRNTGSEVISGDFKEWTTPRYRMTNIGIGNQGFAISPHILMSAGHWAYGNRKAHTTMNFDDGNGHTATVTKTNIVDASVWAEKHAVEYGISEDEVGILHDCVFMFCDNSAAIPDGCIPYFINQDTWEEWFGVMGNAGVGGNYDSAGTHYRVMGWHVSAESIYAQPATIGYYGNYLLSNFSKYARQDLIDLWDSKSMSPYCEGVHWGDSGRPFFFLIDDKPVVVSYGVTIGGPQLCKCYNFIKAVVEWYGDSLKTLTTEDLQD